MAQPSIPQQLYIKTHHLLGAMEIIAQQLGHSKEQAENLFRLLPKGLKNTPTFQYYRNKKWYYEYGLPYEKPNSKEIIFGSDQCPLVERLYTGIFAIEKYLSDSQLLEYLERLSDRSKHLEVLSEAVPLTIILDSVKVDYEIEGYGEGNKKIDYLITTGKTQPILLDVKCRVKELIYKFAQPIPPDPNSLFPSTAEKFKQNDPKDYLQGVWINSQLKYNFSQLKPVFDKIDPKKIHFAILACWNIQAFVLSRNQEIKKTLNSVFKLPEDDTIVIRD